MGFSGKELNQPFHFVYQENATSSQAHQRGQSETPCLSSKGQRGWICVSHATPGDETHVKTVPTRATEGKGGGGQVKTTQIVVDLTFLREVLVIMVDF